MKYLRYTWLALTEREAGKVAQWVKVLATMPDDLSSTREQIWKERAGSCMLSSDDRHLPRHCITLASIHPISHHTNKKSNKK